MSEALATFGNGCFWCTEAVFSKLEGVNRTMPGYSGGQVKDPTYKHVCTGETGHAEVLQITFDPNKISFDELLEVFWKTHDPTTLNRQGNDIGTQYRSAVFYHDEEQRVATLKQIEQLTAAEVWKDPIVTEVNAFDTFYPAEDYHKDYFEHHGSEPYCSLVIRPKVEKFEKAFNARLK